MTDTEVVQIMQQLAEQYGCTGLRPGEFTVRMFSESNKLSMGAAAAAIDRGLADGGIVYVAKRKIGTRLVKAYRQVASTEEAGFTAR